MNREEPRQPYGVNGAYGGNSGYVANGAYGTQMPVAPARSTSHRGAWIGAGATLVAAVIGVVGTYLVTSNKGNANPTPPAAQGAAPSALTPGEENQGGDGAPSDSSQSPESPESTESAGSTGSTESSESPDPTAPPTTPPTTPPGKPAGTVMWQGALAIRWADDKDLDSAPPVESEINEDNDFAVYPWGTTHMLQPENRVKALVWKDTAKVPTHKDCAGVVDTLGTSSEVKLKTGLVVCASTNDGRLARLTVKELTGQGSDTTGVFDVVVWTR
ncbi:hypothetical protein R1T08_13945 [Streptomyces sp. SBC-4]|nr:hypothetical protein [Streptomyces sp. SBC-4]MDV5145288.1 hypothetical protein [Streptomyces sp. SBC-4]